MTSSDAPDDELPGMLAIAKGVAEQRWPHTMDAAVWAAEFLKRYPGSEFSEGDMIGWFANAIMAGYDTAQARRSDRAVKLPDEIELLFTEVGIYVDTGERAAGGAGNRAVKVKDEQARVILDALKKAAPALPAEESGGQSADLRPNSTVPGAALGATPKGSDDDRGRPQPQSDAEFTRSNNEYYGYKP